MNNDKLYILWTTGDKEVAMNMIMMYTFNAKARGWWKEIDLIVWGPSAKLLSQDEDLQFYIKKIINEGVKVSACRACADEYGVTNKLEEQGITVMYMGEELTRILKEESKLITF